jgi:hypothetical protein
VPNSLTCRTSSGAPTRSLRQFQRKGTATR